MAIASRFLLSAGLLPLVYLVIVTALWNLGLSAQDRGLPRLIPDDPDIIFAEAMVEFRQSQGRISQLTRAGVDAAARLDPLEEDPLLFEAAKLRERGAKGQATLLLERARQRNPRARDAHIFLLDQYIESGNAGGATQEIAVLTQLQPAAHKLLSDTLTRLASDPKTRAATLAELSRHPNRKSVLQNMANVGASPFLIIGMSEDMKGTAGEDEDKQWVINVIQPYLDRDDLAGGQKLWAHFYGRKLPAGQANVFDGEFEDLAEPPFGWMIKSGQAGVAQVRNGRLEVEYYGRDTIVFARQLMLLAPGNYRLSFKASSGGEEKPDLAWRVDCLVGGKTLLDFPLNPSSTFALARTDEFTVPEEGCPGQWLALTGRPMEFPKTRFIAFDQVRVRRQDASQ